MPPAGVGRQQCQRPTLDAEVAASNACNWLNLILKCRFCFACRFPRFIASYACYNTRARCLPPCFDLAPRLPCFPVVFASDSLSLSLLHIARLHRFPCLYNVSRACTIFCTAFASFSALFSYCLHHFLRPLWFIPCMSLASHGFHRSFVLSPAFALGQ